MLNGIKGDEGSRGRQGIQGLVGDLDSCGSIGPSEAKGEEGFKDQGNLKAHKETKVE